MKKTTGILQISQLANVSPAAVSRALRGRGGVSENTFNKIVTIAKDLGYSRKPGSVPLKKIALLMPHRAHSAQSFYFREVYSGLVDGLYSAGISLINIPLIGSLKGGLLSRQLQTEQIDIAVLLYQVDNQLADVLAKTGVHSIALASSADNMSNCVIDYDNISGIEMLLKHLDMLGHKHIGLIDADPSLHHHSERIHAYRQFMEKKNLFRPDHCQVLVNSGTADGGRYGALQLMQQYPECTAIMALNDRLAMGVCTAVASAGKSVPADIAITGFDDIDSLEYANVKLTTIHVPYYDMALRAASLITKYVETGEFTTEKIVEPIQLIIRDSTIKN